jgi:hypothetical protein
MKGPHIVSVESGTTETRRKIIPSNQSIVGLSSPEVELAVKYVVMAESSSQRQMMMCL